MAEPQTYFIEPSAQLRAWDLKKRTSAGVRPVAGALSKENARLAAVVLNEVVVIVKGVEPEGYTDV